ncbi:hypothetical protein [Kitasatospora sp. NBC_01266]|uniref:hypothetical protein n=1 Tax=Kitasatospora sp. NBC_01266 TaxID=2903572 RepID=UPI002E35FD43|nr:hypothetical protein [Kitasatospora sp. NBC_01266]
MSDRVRVALTPDPGGLLAQLEPAGAADAAPLLAQLTGGPPHRGPGVVDEHLSADLAGPSARLPLADVLYGGPRFVGREAELLDRYPGCLVVATGWADGALRTQVRTGALVAWLPGLGGRGVPAGMLGSLLHAWLVTGAPAGALGSVALLVPGGAFRVDAQPASRRTASASRSASGAPSRR